MAKQKFNLAIRELENARSAYSKIWVIDGYHFPKIRLIIKNTKGTPRIGLLLDLRNYDYLPPSATLMDIRFKQFIGLNQVPVDINGTPDGRPHIMYNQQTKRIWFCLPGVQEFHNLYPEAPWEFIRYKDESNILTIVDNIINLIDRKKV